MPEPVPLVVVENVSFRYGDGPVALRGVNLTLGSGEFVALAGVNGSGKTTLAKQLNGLLKPDVGRVLVEGADTRSRSLGQLARTVGYAFQNPDHQIFLPTVAEEVAFGPRNLGVSGAELDERVNDALVRFDLRDLRERHPTLLGWAIRRRVALASVYAMRPRLLVLDEPTSGLDRRATDRLMATLAELVGERRTVVLITHDMRLVAEHVARLVVLRAGEVLADGSTPVILSDLALLASAGIRAPQVTRLAADLAPLGMPPALDVATFVAGVLARVGPPRPRPDGSAPA